MHRENPSIKTYVNKIENRISFKIKIGYTLKTFNKRNNEITWKH